MLWPSLWRIVVHFVLRKHLCLCRFVYCSLAYSQVTRSSHVRSRSHSSTYCAFIMTWVSSRNRMLFSVNFFFPLLFVFRRVKEMTKIRKRKLLYLKWSALKQLTSVWPNYHRSELWSRPYSTWTVQWSTERELTWVWHRLWYLTKSFSSLCIVWMLVSIPLK